MRATGLLDRARSYLGHWQWNLGLVAQSAEDILARGLAVPVRWLPPPPTWTFFADPFVLPEPGGVRLYAERMDYRRGRGEIWSGPLDTSAARWASLRPLLAEPAHMSFPFAFFRDGVPHLLCETWEAGGASLYSGHGGVWRPEGRIAPQGRAVVDGALHHDGARWWLFCGHPGADPDAALYLYHAAELAGPWTPHPANPVIRGAGGARSAGPLFTTGLGLIRPAQDCSRTYGGALVLQRVLALTPDEYREEPVRRLDPVVPWGQGLHHLCPAGAVTVIDGKRWRFHPLDPLRKAVSGWRTRRRRALLRRPAPPMGGA